MTIENFLAWKTKFDAEMAESNKRKLDNDTTKNKLSGINADLGYILQFY